MRWEEEEVTLEVLDHSAVGNRALLEAPMLSLFFVGYLTLANTRQFIQRLLSIFRTLGSTVFEFVHSKHQLFLRWFS